MSSSDEELAAFVAARLDEDEAGARDASDPMEEAPSSWRYDEDARPVPRIIGASWESSYTDGVWNCEDPGDGCEELRQVSRAAGIHIARHDPARALREVAAKRKILAEHKAVIRLAELTGQELGFLGWYREWVLKNLAAAWSDHPAYRPEWAPD